MKLRKREEDVGKINIQPLYSARYRATLSEKSADKLYKLSKDPFFQADVQRLRKKYNIPPQGLDLFKQLPSPEGAFERDIKGLRKKFKLSSRWHLPISVYISSNRIDGSLLVCGLEFYKANWEGEDQLLLVRIHGDTTEKEYREAWPAIEKLKKQVSLRDKEQFRYKNYMLDDLIWQFYRKYNHPAIIAEKLSGYLWDKGMQEWGDKCSDESFIRVRLARIKKRKPKTIKKSKNNPWGIYRLGEIAK